jgi:hypothetical protein
MANPVIHLEIQADDVARAKKSCLRLRAAQGTAT